MSEKAFNLEHVVCFEMLRGICCEDAMTSGLPESCNGDGLPPEIVQTWQTPA
jgi:hypothetical protein